MATATAVYTEAEQADFLKNVSKGDGEDACWLWTGPGRGRGYGRMGAGHSREYAHRGAWKIASGKEIPDKLVIGHVCDTRRCVRNDQRGTYTVRGVVLPRFGHLFCGTHMDNLHDRDDKGRGAIKKSRPQKPGRARGIRVSSAKLTDDRVLEIIKRYRSGGVRQRELAQEYGIDQSIVSGVISGKRWKHVQRGA